MLVELGLVEQRYKAVLEVLDGAVSVTDVARRYGVGRPGGHPAGAGQGAGLGSPRGRRGRERHRRSCAARLGSRLARGGSAPFHALRDEPVTLTGGRYVANRHDRIACGADRAL